MGDPHFMYDIVIIGAGTAGIAAANQLQKLNVNYLLVEEGDGGTTCAKTGCMPSKALIEIAKKVNSIQYLTKDNLIRLNQFNINTASILTKVRKFRDHFVERTIKGSEKFPRIKGHAKFIDTNTIDVSGEKISANNFIIACGSRPRIPGIFEEVKSNILTTDNFFEQEKLPDSIAVIGLGIIGVELAQALARLGVNVQVCEEHKTIAGIQDEKVFHHALSLQQQYYPINFNTKIKKVTKQAEQFSIDWGSDQIKVDQVLLCAGRKSNIDQLNLDKLGIDTSKAVNTLYDPYTLQISNFPIYVAGDASSRKMIVHEASEEARIAVYNAMHKKKKKLTKPFLNIVFTDPPIARVGQSLNQLDQDEYIIGEFEFYLQGRATLKGENYGIVRVYVHSKNYHILGAEMIAPGADNFSHLLIMAIQNKISIHELLQLPIYHPVLEEGLRQALINAKSKLTVKEISKKAVEV